MNILQYESKIWATADLLRGSGIKESEWPSFMMPFFALAMIESRLIRMFDELKAEIGEEAFGQIEQDDLVELIKDRGQGYNVFIFEKNQSLSDICTNDKSFDIDMEAYLNGFDGETKDLLGVDAVEGEKFLDIKGVITKLKAKKILFSYTKLWAEIDLKPFNNSEITTLEEHIKRKWADISAETAGEQYTPDDVIALIAEIIASKIEETDTLLKIYDCTCGGGNMLFGVEDRINQKFKRLTQTYGQDWNDALYALAKIESRFRPDSKIEHGNTLVEDKFSNEEFDVVVANPPYGVSWKGYAKDIQNDKTERFKYLPSLSDGQLLFMQHLVAKLDAVGMGVVVHNGSTLFSGDAGSAESNIRQWMLDKDLVEAVIQLPTDEFFNTGIYTYLWVLNKNKRAEQKGKVMLLNASEKFKPLKKSKGSKRKEVDEANRLEIVATLSAFEDNEYARVFAKEFFSFNKQAIMLTNVDEQGKSYESNLPRKKDRSGEMQPLKSVKLVPTAINQGEIALTAFTLTEDKVSEDSGCSGSNEYGGCASLKQYFTEEIKPLIARLDYKEQPLRISTAEGQYWYDPAQETLIREVNGKQEALGCGKIIVKAGYKKATKKLPARIEISVELTPDYQKDYEIIPFHRDPAENQAAIEAFMARYINKPFRYLENVVGVELNFNKIFYTPEVLRPVSEIMGEIAALDGELEGLEAGLSLTQYGKLKQSLINETVTRGLDKSVPMKENEIDWLRSEIPLSWDVVRIKDLAFLQSGSSIISEQIDTEGDYPVYGGNGLRGFYSNYTNDGNYILIGRQGALCGNVNYAKGKFWASEHAVVVYLKRHVNMKWFGELLKVMNLNQYSLAAAQPGLAMDRIKRLMLPLPPLAEQKAIVAYLDEKTTQTDRVVTTINNQINKLKELRKALINDVVTGKIKVVSEEQTP